jgi:hypothetical protein
MSALDVAIIYFGTFLGIGWVAKILIDYWMGSRGMDLDDVQAQAGPKRPKRRMFLLGSWRWEE